MRWLIDFVRGILIGAAEVVPGVSGGTIALIVGIYKTLIDQAAHIILAVKYIVKGGEDGQSRLAAAWQQVTTARWDILLPVAIGMVSAVLIGAKIIEPVIEEYPEQARGLFSGLVVAGLWVPVSMVGETKPGRWRPQDVLLALAAVAVAFVLTGLPPGNITDPSPLLIMAAAAVAVCALVLPGVSGSFLLLSIGLYGTTIQAVNDRDLAYLGIFALGAAVGLGTFVVILQWLLANKARVTIVIITGLMAGSLRALWPWQTEDRDLLAPSGEVGSVVLMFLIGFGVVAGLLALEKRFRHHLVDEPTEEQPQTP